MGNGIYKAVSGSVAQMKNLDVLANNLAHVDTPGFKADALRFEEALDNAQNGTKFVDTPGTSVRMTQGALRKTDNPLDVALTGDGFLVVDTPDGSKLTRAGRLMIAEDGTLQTAAGLSVQGLSGSINVPPALNGNQAAITIDGKGQVMRGDQIAGQLRVVSARGDQLIKAGADMFDAVGGVDSLPTTVEPHVMQGHLEDANVNPVVAMTQIITVQRTFEALQQAVRTYREVDGQSVRRMR